MVDLRGACVGVVPKLWGCGWIEAGMRVLGSVGETEESVVEVE